MRISDWSSDVCSSDLKTYAKAVIANAQALAGRLKERGSDIVSGGTDTHLALVDLRPLGVTGKDADEALERSAITCNKNGVPGDPLPPTRSEEHTSELQSLMRISYAVFCLKKKNKKRSK